MKQQVPIELILAGKRTTHYYSGFGSSYGNNPLRQLEGYLDIGARLSPRGWDLFQKLRTIVKTEISDRILAQTIVYALTPDRMKYSDLIEFLATNLQSTDAAEIVLHEIDSIKNDIAIFAL